MKSTYYRDDDTLVIRLSDKPVVREVSQDWNIHVSYAEDGSVVETVILDAAKVGAWPLRIEEHLAVSSHVFHACLRVVTVGLEGCQLQARACAWGRSHLSLPVAVRLPGARRSPGET